MQELSQNLYLFRDTCHVYLIRNGSEAVLVDFGDGGVLDHLEALGVQRVTDILMTHHHRDQGQGLARVVSSGQAYPALRDTRIWAPYAEQDLFQAVDVHWQTRPLLNHYDVRQDRFSLLEPVPLAGMLKDYQTYTFGGRDWQVLPTPGHTPGSLTLLVEIDGQSVAFTGDLIAGPGKVWSMAALQWQYQDAAGAAAMIPSLLDLKQRQPDLLLPSHGEVMPDPAGAIDLLAQRLRMLLDARQENLRMMDWLERPYEAITPHLLRNRTSVANSYVLLSESGKALLIDYGYDFVTTNLFGPDRALHRPWLYTLPALKRDYGVRCIDVALATHYHDDHVAGFNLLREIEGAQVWAAETFADILNHPNVYDLPCLWYDPIQVDRILPPGKAVRWEEYELTAYPLPGHTRYATAIAFEVDGRRVLATGDQHKGNAGLDWNYVYQNRFEIEDYAASAAFYAQMQPDLILPGHWEPLWVDEAYLRRLCERGAALADLHRDLLPLEQINLGGEGFAARMQPYHQQARGGSCLAYRVELRNPLAEAADLEVRLVLPAGWQSPRSTCQVHVPGAAVSDVLFEVQPPAGARGRRFRLAVDVKVGELHLGQQAEALIDLI